MKRILQWNPEFARNIWLEFSLQRAIIMPVIVFLVAMLVIVNNENSDKANQILHYVAMSGFILIGMIWGLKTAADALLDEYNDKTWDWQRMSIIGSWKLAWGKLFGSTIYNWYGALLCLAIYLFTSFGMENPGKELETGLLMVVGMISVHSLMILLSLLMIRKGDGRAKIRSNRIFLAGIALVLVLYRPLSFGLSGIHMNLSWYGILTDPLDIALLTSLFYCGWALAGLYRSMRAELQYTDKPNWWTAFLLSSFLLSYGYFFGARDMRLIESLAAALSMTFAQFIVMVYFLALTEPKNIVNFRLLLSSYRLGDYDSLMRNMPLWLVTLPIAVIFGALAAVFLISSGDTPAIHSLIKDFSSARIVLLLVSILGFVIRDLGILLLLHFSPRAKRADGAMLIYLVILYLLLPMLTHNTSIGAAFYPDLSGNAMLMVVFPVAEALLVLYFLGKRWQQMEEKNSLNQDV